MNAAGSKTLDRQTLEVIEGGDHETAESTIELARRWMLGLAYAAKPPRTRHFPAYLYVLARHHLGLGSRNGQLPDPERAFSDGLVDVCASLDVDTLTRAYAHGLYPFCHVGPVKWFAPRERMVLFNDNLHVSKNLKRRIRNDHFRVTFDQRFEDVMRGCGATRQGRAALTWITPQILDAFCALYEAGHAHSVEVWDRDGQLAGGVYGVAVGGVFFGESMFNRVPDSAKVGVTVLQRHLESWGFVLHDAKDFTPHLARLGFELVPRRKFGTILKDACKLPGKPGRWHVDETLDVGNWTPGADRETD